jgi:hypothetical protein
LFQVDPLQGKFLIRHSSTKVKPLVLVLYLKYDPALELPEASACLEEDKITNNATPPTGIRLDYKLAAQYKLGCSKL